MSHFQQSLKKQTVSLRQKSLCLQMIFGLCITTIMLSQAHAGTTVYQFKDDDGNVLLTNVVSANKRPQGERFKSFDKVIKKTYYPESNIHEYKDWGSTEASVPASSSKNKNGYDHIIASASQRLGVDAGLIKAIIHTESGFNPFARSPVGAQGLMQLMPATAKRFGVSDPFNPQQSIEGGTKYLAYLLKKYNHDWQKAIAGYNAGEGNVDKYGGIPPFRETQGYVPKVLSRYRNLYKNFLSSLVTSNSAISSGYGTSPSSSYERNSGKINYAPANNGYSSVSTNSPSNGYPASQGSYSLSSGSAGKNSSDGYVQSAYDAVYR